MWETLNPLLTWVKELYDRLTATWAAQLDTLAGRLTATWAGKLDSLRAAYTDAKAAFLDAAMSSRAAETTPVLGIPIASGLQSGLISAGWGTSNNATNVAGYLGTAAASSAANSGTGFVDAINYTGQGVLEFCAFHNRAGNQNTEQVGEIIIDGVTVYSFTAGSTNAETRCPVGSVSQLTGWNGSAAVYSAAVTLGAVPFKASLQIRHKRGASTGTSTCWWKVRETA